MVYANAPFQTNSGSIAQRGRGAYNPREGE